jgi:hypothetical protein
MTLARISKLDAQHLASCQSVQKCRVSALLCYKRERFPTIHTLLSPLRAQRTQYRLVPIQGRKQLFLPGMTGYIAPFPCRSH